MGTITSPFAMTGSASGPPSWAMVQSSLPVRASNPRTSRVVTTTSRSPSSRALYASGARDSQIGVAVLPVEGRHLSAVAGDEDAVLRDLHAGEDVREGPAPDLLVPLHGAGPGVEGHHRAVGEPLVEHPVDDGRTPHAQDDELARRLPPEMPRPGAGSHVEREDRSLERGEVDEVPGDHRLAAELLAVAVHPAELSAGGVEGEDPTVEAGDDGEPVGDRRRREVRPHQSRVPENPCRRPSRPARSRRGWRRRPSRSVDRSRGRPARRACTRGGTARRGSSARRPRRGCRLGSGAAAAPPPPAR